MGLVAAVLLVLPIAGLTETTLESRIKQRLGLPHPCIADVDASPGWREEPLLPDEVDEPRAVTIDGDIYIAGGISEILWPDEPSNDPAAQARVPVRSTRSLQRFDPDSGRYTDLPPVPEALNHMGMAAYEGDVYVVGGHGNRLWGGDVRREFFRYSVSDRRWEALPSMPTARGAPAVGVLGDRLYVAGGMVAGKPLGRETAALEIYDFRSRRWSKGSDMPAPREHLMGAVAGGAFYVLGGRNEATDALDLAERYDPARDRWESLPPLPVPTGGGAAETVDGDVMVLGGGNDRAGTVTDAVQRIDTESEEWDRRPAMRTGRHGFASAVRGTRIYTFGGSPCALFAATDVAESYDARVDD